MQHLQPAEQAKYDMLKTFVVAWLRSNQEVQTAEKIKRIWTHAKEQLAHLLPKAVRQ